MEYWYANDAYVTGKYINSINKSQETLRGGVHIIPDLLHFFVWVSGVYRCKMKMPWIFWFVSKDIFGVNLYVQLEEI
jgi:hypothetical protein